ncbi:hypothetical protein ASPVEDRAFT_643366 [Aspergillus versicolor CBS 583.65]|uniref:Uncharacterized protein n=1 Tax=Aspergillus versicolor CBS 583.65 TaxID=1036611 RepID=A0A1L9PJ82_ASPVE|nr:uncharacterized protein ASPVEDRAFT_643366 [Aspergillus versicolor CBS 583.65]OJJ01590.1 hypothetical protein ASPVEDRAFT_643366 [Aspergillus versicolor CBS 583.65]
MAWLLRGREGATEETGAWSLVLLPALKAEKEENKEVSGWTRVLIKKQGHDGARGEMRRKETVDGRTPTVHSSAEVSNPIYLQQWMLGFIQLNQRVNNHHCSVRRYEILSILHSGQLLVPEPLVLLENDRACSPLSVPSLDACPVRHGPICASGYSFATKYAAPTKRLTMPALTCRSRGQHYSTSHSLPSVFMTPLDRSVRSLDSSGKKCTPYGTVCPGTREPRYNTRSDISRYRPSQHWTNFSFCSRNSAFGWLFLDPPGYSSSRPDEREH